MRRLVLMRHGKTEARAASGADIDRELTSRGRTDARLVAETLARNGIALQAALVSTARRTRETWEAMAAVLPAVAVRCLPELYEASAEALLAAFDAAPETGVILIAHNPGVGELAWRLAQQAGASDDFREILGGFPTGAAAVFGFDDRRVTALALHSPKRLGGGA